MQDARTRDACPGDWTPIYRDFMSLLAARSVLGLFCIDEAEPQATMQPLTTATKESGVDTRIE